MVPGRSKAMKKVCLVVDVTRCSNCHCCFLADKDEHVDNDWPPYSLAQPKHGHRWIHIQRKERGVFPKVEVTYLPTFCNQCREAPCLAAGPRGAVYQRADGIVIIDPTLAKGCRELVAACPYGHIYWNEEREVPQKWTMSAHLLDAGWKQPRAVQACASGALSFHLFTEREAEEHVAASGLEVLHPEYQTRPRVYYRSLHRFTRAFIAGTIVSAREGIEECAASIAVALFRGDARIQETTTDTFGDFKFDNLPEGSGRYRIQVAHPSKPLLSRDVVLDTSTYLGVIQA
jgi:Fe-S-cluster-containing dehydrogenase component